MEKAFAEMPHGVVIRILSVRSRNFLTLPIDPFKVSSRRLLKSIGNEGWGWQMVRFDEAFVQDDARATDCEAELIFC